MAPPRLPTPLSSEADHQGKRKRQAEIDPNPRNFQRPRASLEAGDEGKEVIERPEAGIYDPDQNPEERRKVRQGLRDLTSKLNENRAEYLKPGSKGLNETFQRANKLFQDVKQTQEATIDSRLLVTATDLSYRQACQQTHGDSVQGVDIEEFVSKCFTFMRSGSDDEEDEPQKEHTNTPSQARRRRCANFDLEECEGGDEGDEGDELNWARLGQMACLQHNSRPSVPGFLLGPLSLEKKARKPAQRSARLKVSDYTQTQPITLKAGEVSKDETKNLTYLTKMIHQKLIQTRKQRVKSFESRFRSNQNMSNAEAKKLMEANGLLYPDRGLNLWQFVVNPRSFGQTVENIFYVSFLLRDGKARLNPDDDGQLGLFPEEPSDSDQQRSKNSTRYNGIIAIDMAEWQTLVELYDIKESMIEHREYEEVASGGLGQLRQGSER